jgi:hypothetical protein
MPAALSEAMNASSVLSACAGMAMPMMAAKLVRVRSSFIAPLIVAEWRSARISCLPRRPRRASQRHKTGAHRGAVCMIRACRQPTVLGGASRAGSWSTRQRWPRSSSCSPSSATTLSTRRPPPRRPAAKPLRLRVPYSTAPIAWTTTLKSRRRTVRKPSPVGPFFHPLRGSFVQCAHPLDA